MMQTNNVVSEQKLLQSKLRSRKMNTHEIVTKSIVPDSFIYINNVEMMMKRLARLKIILDFFLLILLSKDNMTLK